MSASLSKGNVGNVVNGEAAQSAVSWPAIFAGTVIALATVFMLLALGAGLGLTSISPWGNSGVSATTFSVMTAIGLIVVQWLSSGLGGFVAGRLRTKWAGVHTHEVFFRDTAHGLVTWALASLVGVMLLTSAATSVIGGGARVLATVSGGAAQGASGLASEAASSLSGYDIDILFRSDWPDTSASPQQVATEAGRIIAHGISSGDVPAADRAYLAQLVSSRTGISQADSQMRVDTAIEQAKTAATKAKQVADATRKAGTELSIFTALSMLIGAFIACVMAAYGGSLRDEF